MRPRIVEELSRPGPALPVVRAVVHRFADEATRDDLRRDVPAGRTGAPEEIAAAVLHLASDEAGFTVGADLVLDGGVTA
ncbi:SDR family oxidoreductase [Streptomyces blastmyceticus]|uniref:Uncharacterized protein n=1 Tax=Streptomyces blastmyceticus TaxID=68180 RepID=A0ABN0XMG6_9ACTN